MKALPIAGIHCLAGVLPRRIHSESEVNTTQQKMAHNVKRWPSPGISPELPQAKASSRLSWDEKEAVIGGLLSRLLICFPMEGIQTQAIQANWEPGKGGGRGI